MEYSFKKDIKSGLFAILIFIAIAWVYMALLDHFDRYKVESHVIQVTRLFDGVLHFVSPFLQNLKARPTFFTTARNLCWRCRSSSTASISRSWSISTV